MKCDITKRKFLIGNNVSHSNRRTKRKFFLNIFRKRIFIPSLKKYIILNLSTRAIRTINKYNDIEGYIKSRKKCHIINESKKIRDIRKMITKKSENS